MISQVDRFIMAGIQKSLSVRRIATILKISHVAVLKHVKKLIASGYIRRVVMTGTVTVSGKRTSSINYTLTQAGIDFMSQGRDEGLPPPDESSRGGVQGLPPPDEPQQKIRLHRIQLKFDLVSPIKDPSVISFKDHQSKIVPMHAKGRTGWNKNIVSFEDFTVVISTRSIIITGLTRYLDPTKDIEAQEADILSEIVPFAEQVEEKIRRLLPEFRLKRLDRGVLSGKILSREYAFEHHPVAEKEKSMEIRDPEDGKPRIIVDQSKGFPELEFVHNQYATGDSETSRRNYLTLATVDLHDALNVITSQVRITDEILKLSSRTQDQLDQVAASLSQVVKALGGIL